MICAWVFALAACTAAPAADIDAFFKEFSARRDGVVALDASFTQKTKLPDEELSTKGTLTFIKPRRIIFHTEDPDRTTLVDDRSGYEYDPEIKQLQIFDIEDNPQADIFFLGFNSNTETLRKAYDITLFDIPDDPRGKHGITIKPKADSKEQAYFIEVNLYLRDEDYLPYRIHIRNDEESQVFIEVESIDKTFRPTPQLTQIFLPEDTKVVENDRVVETVGAGGKRVPDAILMPPEPGALAPAQTKPLPSSETSVALPPPPPLVPAGSKKSASEPAPAAAPKAEPVPATVPAPAVTPVPEPAPEKKLELTPAPASKAKAKSVTKSQGGTKKSTAASAKKSTANSAKKSTAGTTKKSAPKAAAVKKADAKPADGGKAKSAQ